MRLSQVEGRRRIHQETSEFMSSFVLERHRESLYQRRRAPTAKPTPPPRPRHWLSAVHNTAVQLTCVVRTDLLATTHVQPLG